MAIILFGGNIADLDPIEGNTLSENAGDLLGVTLTNDTLQLVDVTQIDADGSGALDDNDLGAGEVQTYDLGAGPIASVLDSTQAYTIDILLGDGTPITGISVVVIQNENGDFFIEELGGVPDALDNLNIQSITFTGIVTADATGDTLPNPDILNTRIVCFCAGTLIECPTGGKPVEALRAGELVSTLDHGAQQLRWVYSRSLDGAELDANPSLYPVRISAGMLGDGHPKRDLLVSRQHRFLVRSPIAERVTGASEVLVSAIKLTALPGIYVDETVEQVEYFHLMFDRHEIMFAEGTPSESFSLGPEALKSLPLAARCELETLYPDFAEHARAQANARPVPSGKLQKKLAQRLAKNNRPLLAS